MIRELKTLVAIAREGTFAAAGDSIGLTQAAVSAQMQRLETELGFPLFERSGRAAQLNPAGQQVLAQAHEVIRLYDNLGSTPAELPAEVLVSIGAIASLQRTELLSTQSFIRYDRASFGGRQVDRFLRKLRVPLREVCEVDELDAIVALVANGVGVALVPQTTTHKRWPAAVRALDLGAQTFYRDVGLVHRARGNLSEPARLLAELILGVAAKTSSPD
jgi:DNA-binding transcriptional LysR family regulator